MSETTPEAPSAAVPPPARRWHSPWPGLVWALPLAAVLIVAYLGLQALVNRGVKVVVTFSNAAGAQVGDTKVIYLGAEAGHVSKIEINKSGHGVDMTLRLSRRAQSVLNSNTKFWLIGAKPSLTDIASVKAALTGLAIGMSRGVGGRPADRFVGLEDAPVVDPSIKGASYVLDSDEVGSLAPGADLLYRGQNVGKVTSTKYLGPARFEIDVFVLQPFEALIRPDTAFWVGDPLQLSLSGQGLTTKLGPASSLLSGSVDLDERDPETAMPPSPPGARFALYRNQVEAQRGPNGPSVLYRVELYESAGELSQGASVRLAGYQVGDVESSRLEFAPDGSPYTTAVLALYPLKLHAEGPRSSSDPAAWRPGVDAVVERLLSHGYRARLVQVPPLIGGGAIELSPVKGAGRAQLGAGPYPLIPSVAAPGGLDDLMTQADGILTKVNQVPIAEIGQDARRIMRNLAALTSSPKVNDSLNHLNSTLRQVDEITAEAKPELPVLVAKLKQVADQMSAAAAAGRGLLSGDNVPQDEGLPAAVRQLGDAARSMRALADYLDRHPEALIQGKGKDKK